MKKIVSITLIAAMLASCSTSKKGQGAVVLKQNASSSQIVHLPGNSSAFDALSTDTIVVSGSQYIPLEGRSETGTRAELEGAWELDSLNGAVIPGKSGINVEVTTSKIPEGSEVRHDSTTSTTVVNGITRTTTTVLIDRMGTTGNKITPPQGTNYHIPAKPGINFYGANETFAGFTGCNKFSGRYIITGRDTINLASASASTKMVCMGDYDENAFLNTLKQVNSFKTSNGRLLLLGGNKVLLVFSKKQL